MKKALILLFMAATLFMGINSNQPQAIYLDESYGEVGGASPVAT